MNRKIKILTSFVLAVIMTVSCFAGTRTVSKAANATFSEASASYKSGPYYKALTNVVLTGNLRTDIINIAKSQIGYQEAEKTGQYTGTVPGGNNFTEYGRWFGVDGGQWCAMFVSWCAYVAGVSSSIIPQHSYTENGAAFYLSKNRAYDWSVIAAGAYTPQPGDVVYFYSGTAGRTVTHIGLVEKYENGVLHTIEGNASSAEFTTDGGCCCRRQYNTGSEYVKYICNPDYNSKDEGIDAPKNSAGYYLSLGYYVTTGGLNVRNIPSSTASGTSVLGTMSSGSYFKCLEVVNDKDSSQNKKWAKISYEGKTAYMSLNSANIIFLGDTLPAAFDPYKLTTNKAQYITGEMILVNAQGTRAADWIGVYKKGENSDVNNGGVKAIYYSKLMNFADGSIIINGAMNNLGSGGRADAASFSKGLPAGQYTVKYFKNGSYEVVKSLDITVKSGTLDDMDVPTPQWAWDFGQQPYGTTNAVISASSDYITVTDNTGDAWIHPKNGTNLGSGAINLNKAKYAVVKMQITSGSSNRNQLEILLRSGQIVSYKVLDTTTDWQYVIINCEKTIVGTWAGSQTWLRIDPVNCKGSVCKIDWMAFFQNASEANEFVFAEKTGLVTDVKGLNASSSTTTSTATPKPTATPTAKPTATTKPGTTTTTKPAATATTKPGTTVTTKPTATNGATNTGAVSTETGAVTDIPVGLPTEDASALPGASDDPFATDMPTGEVTDVPVTDGPVVGETDDPVSTETNGTTETMAPETKQPLTPATKAPADTSSKKDSGCGSVIYGGGAMAVVLAAAMVWLKKREEK